MSINKSTFRISQMDCASEEEMIRMKLNGLSGISHLDFDLDARMLKVFHEGPVGDIQTQIHSLRLGDELIETKEAEAPRNMEDSQQKRILLIVLAINFLFFVVEMLFGWLSDSMGLIADSLDMLADSLVYALSLFAVGALASRKKKLAKVSGYLQLTLALLGFAEVLRRFFGAGEIPLFRSMIIISALALAGNALSLYLIKKAKSNEVHMKASVIFTSNDIVVNLGVILAGILVYFTASRIPDLVIGSIVFLVVMRGAIRILRLSKS